MDLIRVTSIQVFCKLQCFFKDSSYVYIIPGKFRYRILVEDDKNIILITIVPNANITITRTSANIESLW